MKSPEASLDFRLRAGLDTLLFEDSFAATTQNTSLWSYTLATLSCTQPGAGTVNFGTVQGTIATHGAFMRTFQHFPVIGTAPLAVEAIFGQFTVALVANEEWRVGLGLPTVAGTAPTDGCWFKLTSAGLIGEAVFSGVTTPTGVLASLADFTVGSLYKLVIVVGKQSIEFWKNDVLLGSLVVPAGSGQPFQAAALPMFMQKLCTGNVASTNTMRVSNVTVSLMDIASNKPWAEQLSIAGRSGNLGQNGHTQGKTTLWANSGVPSAAALQNAASTFTGLGGIVAVLPTLTVGTDGILISYLNPVPTINIPGKNLVIKGVMVNGAVSVVFNGGPVTYAAAIAYGHTALSLATAETGSFVTGTTHAPRIFPIGMQNYIVTAPVGTVGTPITMTFDSPLVVRPGEYVQIILRNIGVVTTTGAITFVIAYDSYFE